MKTRNRLASTRHPLGSVGLLLVGLVGRLAPHAYSAQTDHGRIKAFLARRAAGESRPDGRLRLISHDTEERVGDQV